MSKQLKYKFKKTLKNAEFVHADLEYHKELLPEAQNLFNEEIARVVDELPDEDRKKMNEILEERIKLQQEQIIQNAKKKQDRAEEEESQAEYCGSTALTKFEGEIDDSEDVREKPERKKTGQLRKLFHKIAEQTHPDKVQANGFSNTEVIRREKIFKRALDAYNNDNWYILYSIGVSLDILMNDVSQEHIDWVEEDIRQTLAEISGIGSLLAWAWYVGDDATKGRAVRDYFYQVCGTELQSL